MRDVISGCAWFVCVLLRFNKKLFYPFMFYEPISKFIDMRMCCYRISCHHSTLNGLFHCFRGMTSLLAKSKQTIGAHFQAFFLQYSYFLMFLNIQIHVNILKTYDPQFTLTTKKSLHIICKVNA